MGWNISNFDQFVNPGFERINKKKNRDSLLRTPKSILNFDSNEKESTFDKFTPRSASVTNPFYSKNKDLKPFLKPFVRKQAADPQPVSSLSLLQDSCLVSNIAKSFMKALDAKDPYTKSHSQAVKKYSKALAQKLNLSSSEVELISLASVFHDIGKIGVPEAVLHKQSKLDDDEYEIIKKHPETGSRILENIPTFKGIICDVVRHHHENWDGSGYPDKLSGRNIPLGARIVAIADTFHAMISDRPYRKGLPLEESILRLKQGSGSQWDPELVDKFIDMIFSTE